MAVDPKVQEVIGEIRDVLDLSWEGTMGEELRPWMDFSGIRKVGKFDYAGFEEVFSRKKMSDDYSKARAGSAPVSKNVWVPKLSSDLIGGFKRDHLIRTRSRIRFFAHAAVRQKANGADNGPLTTHTVTTLAMIEAAPETT